MLHKDAKCSLCDRVIPKDREMLTLLTGASTPAFVCSTCYGLHVDNVTAKLRILLGEYGGTPEQKEEIRKLLHSIKPWEATPSDKIVNDFLDIHIIQDDEEEYIEDKDTEDGEEPCDCPICTIARMLGVD